MSTTAAVTTIGGAAILVANIKCESISWDRRLDEFGTARIAVNAQCIPPQLIGAHPWVHELRIEVDGELAWVGPIRYVILPLNDNTNTQLIIEAYEIAYWFVLRFARIAIDYTETNTSVSEVVRQIATAAISPDDPNMLPFLEVFDSSTVHDREVKPNDNAWRDHLRDVVGSLMHMRSFGRSVSFWGYGECLGMLPRVRADQFEGFNNLVYDGERFATDAAVYGASARDEVAAVEADPGPPVIVGKPAEPATPDILGLAINGGSADFPGVRVERTYRDDTYLNDASATRFAQNAIVRRSPLGMADQDVLRAETRCDSPWPITRVAPGMCTTVGSRYGEHAMQIDSVSGRVEANGVETFSIGFNELQEGIKAVEGYEVRLSKPVTGFFGSGGGIPPTPQRAPYAVYEWDASRIYDELPAPGTDGLVNLGTSGVAFDAPRLLAGRVAGPPYWQAVDTGPFTLDDFDGSLCDGPLVFTIETSRTSLTGEVIFGANHTMGDNTSYFEVSTFFELFNGFQDPSAGYRIISLSVWKIVNGAWRQTSAEWNIDLAYPLGLDNVFQVTLNPATYDHSLLINGVPYTEGATFVNNIDSCADFDTGPYPFTESFIYVYGGRADQPWGVERASWERPVTSGGVPATQWRVDSGFNTAPGTIGVNSVLQAIALQPDGKIVIGGAFTTARGTVQNRIARLNTDGTLDTTFNTGGTIGTDQSIVRAIAIQPDGKIVIGGDFTTARGTTVNRIARLNSDGTVDTGFNTGGTVGTNNYVYAVAIQPDGKILIGGQFTTARGTTVNRIARLNSDGTVDTGFNTGGTVGVNFAVQAIALQPDGKVLIGGDFTTARGITQNRIARLNTDGTLDTSFNTGGSVGVDTSEAFTGVFAITIQPDGKILIGGDFVDVRGITQNGVARLNTDGTLDTTFNTGGTVGVAFGPFANWVSRIVLLADGSIFIGGEFHSVRGVSQKYMAILNADGTLNESFAPFAANGGNLYVVAGAVQPDGKILVGGNFTTVNQLTQNRLSRLTPP